MNYTYANLHITTHIHIVYIHFITIIGHNLERYLTYAYMPVVCAYACPYNMFLLMSYLVELTSFLCSFLLMLCMDLCLCRGDNRD